jgi:hypothetical protein
MKVARLIMNHRTKGDVFNKHYARGPSNVQLVSLPLGEIKGTKESKAGESLEVSCVSLLSFGEADNLPRIIEIFTSFVIPWSNIWSASKRTPLQK